MAARGRFNGAPAYWKLKGGTLETYAYILRFEHKRKRSGPYNSCPHERHNGYRYPCCVAERKLFDIHAARRYATPPPWDDVPGWRAHSARPRVVYRSWVFGFARPWSTNQARCARRMGRKWFTVECAALFRPLGFTWVWYRVPRSKISECLKTGGAQVAFDLRHAERRTRRGHWRRISRKRITQIIAY